MNKLSRKNFLVRSGIILTVPAFLEYCASSSDARLAGKSGDDPLENANSEKYEEPILKAINVGITAPNPHNTQPWKFKILNSTEMHLYVDEKRILSITDVPSRQIHIGQGTFLELLKIGAKQIGYDTEIKLLPDGDYKLEEIGKKPVAKIKLSASKVSGHILYDSIKLRATNRALYEGNFITEEEVTKLRELANPENSELKFILNDSEMNPYREIFYNAAKLESYNEIKNDESRIWFRFNDKEIQTKRDGISLPGNAVTGFSRFMAETFFLGPEPKKFHDKQGIDIYLARYKERMKSIKGIVFWKTKTNTKKDWILTGMDYARFHLGATKLGLKMHPMSECLQEYSEMESIRLQMEALTGAKGNEKVQMIARLGRSDYKFFSPRRSLKDMIV
ncbi:MAG: hypothetical protein KBA66_05095 [Leptospiraceae bacterium]|nr:hypothetical protein [Leptospiraceae bacterium]